MAVEPPHRGQGVGAALMTALEHRAAQEGAAELWLNSRNTAYAFYERLGYISQGEEFVSELTGIPHRLMRKSLGSGV